jgi:cytoskeletal protein CcmA (bactofilin family)
MSMAKNDLPHGAIGSLIGVGTRITGTVTFAGGLRVDGEITGNVNSKSVEDGTLVLGEQGRVEGKLVAPRVVINGTVVGQTISTDFVELQPGARIKGNTYYKRLAMRPGAAVDGQLVHCIDKADSGELELVYEGAAAARS